MQASAAVHGRIYSQIVGTTGDSCPSIWFFFENNRYIVNCGEGFQRFCNQHQLKLARAQKFVLLTHKVYVFANLFLFFLIAVFS